MKACDVCGIDEVPVLTRHHFTKREKHILKHPKSHKNWTWRCANCHMAFNKLGVIKFYEIGGYWDTHFMINASRPPVLPELDRYLVLTSETHVSQPPRPVAPKGARARAFDLYHDPKG